MADQDPPSAGSSTGRSTISGEQLNNVHANANAQGISSPSLPKRGKILPALDSPTSPYSPRSQHMSHDGSSAGSSTLGSHHANTHADANATSPRQQTTTTTPGATSSRPREPIARAQALHDFDPALLPLHSAGTNINLSMYLPLRAGEVVRVFVKDVKGWWDGEAMVEGAGDKARKRRGWFPSNYVRELGSREVSPCYRCETTCGSYNRSCGERADRVLSPTLLIPIACNHLLLSSTTRQSRPRRRSLR
jgi:hypothetical protein